METEEKPLPEVSDFKMTPGKGVTAYISGEQLVAGNVSLLLEQGVVIGEKMRQFAEE